MTYWEFKGRELINCTCEYGCNCQFNALPDKGHCYAVAAIHIDEGRHGDTRLDGLRIGVELVGCCAEIDGLFSATAQLDLREDVLNALIAHAPGFGIELGLLGSVQAALIVGDEAEHDQHGEQRGAAVCRLRMIRRGGAAIGR